MGTDNKKKSVRFFKARSRHIRLLRRAIDSVLKRWKVQDLPRLVIGAKSIWSPSEKKWLYQRTKNLAEKVTVMSDIELAHLERFRGKPGVLILAGTGSIALGRNNWKFCSTEAGGRNVAIMQTLLSTCTIHELDHYDYLCDVLQRIETHPVRDVHLLTPRLWKQHFSAAPMRSPLQRVRSP